MTKIGVFIIVVSLLAALAGTGTRFIAEEVVAPVRGLLHKGGI